MNEWNQQFGLVHDCLRACVFGDYLTKKNSKHGAWPSIADMCYSDAVISWNSIFGVYSSETHWKTFVSKIEIPKGDELKDFNKDMIIEYLGITETTWGAFHKSMVDARNTRIVHLNTKQKIQ